MCIRDSEKILQEKDEFRKGDIVWAKVKGYSWWPAKIRDVFHDQQKKLFKARKYIVDFIGDSTYQTLPEGNIVDFALSYQKHSITK